MRLLAARIGLVAVFLAIFACGYAAWRWVGALDEEWCFVCRRPVHAESKTVAYSEGKRSVFCCPACAASHRRQSGKPVIIAEFTDYETGRRLRPSEAVLVEGGDVNPCARTEVLVDAFKHTAHEHFDRCVPGMLAFSSPRAAAYFAARHGGRILRFSEIAGRYE